MSNNVNQTNYHMKISISKIIAQIIVIKKKKKLQYKIVYKIIENVYEKIPWT